MPSLGHPHLTCFLCFYVACGSSASRPLAQFLEISMFLHCCTSPQIDTHQVPSRNPGRRRPHDVSVDVKVDQCASNVIRHVIHRVKVMRMCLMIEMDNNAEHDGIDDRSSVNVAQVVVILQLGGHGGWHRENDAAQSMIVLVCGCHC